MKPQPIDMLKKAAIRCIAAAVLCLPGAWSAWAQEAFPYPAIPQGLRLPQERGAWLLEHYWDGYNFTDTSLISRTEVAEQGFANFVDLLPRMDSLAAERGVDAFAKGAFSPDTPEKVRSYFAGLTELYLFGEDSPLRSDALYILFLRRMSTAPAFSEAERGRFSWLLGRLRQNQPGSIAADFSYIDRSGHRSSMQDTDAELLLLYLHDPGCDVCHSVTAQLAADPLFTADPRIKVLAIAPDEDETAYSNRQTAFPPTWIDALCTGSGNAWAADSCNQDTDGIQATESGSAEIRQHYFIRSLPAIYLLNRDKRVLLKEPSPEALRDFLMNY